MVDHNQHYHQWNDIKWKIWAHEKISCDKNKDENINKNDENINGWDEMDEMKMKNKDEIWMDEMKMDEMKWMRWNGSDENGWGWRWSGWRWKDEDENICSASTPPSL